MLSLLSVNFGRMNSMLVVLLGLSLISFLLIVPPQNLAAQAVQNGPDRSTPVDLGISNQPVVTRAEAYSGTPMGIAKVSFRMRNGDQIILDTGATQITEASNRILYPVLTKTPVRQFMQTISGNTSDHPNDVHTFWFLFKGDQPLQLTLWGTGNSRSELEVEIVKPRKFSRQLNRWWTEFNRAVAAQAEGGDYPAVVETYLAAMISRRLGLEIPKRFAPEGDVLQQTAKLLFDVESLRLDGISRAMAGLADNQEVSLPMPAPIQWKPVRVGDLSPDIDIEAIARGVPEECFYLRFGTWDHQIWLQKLMEEYGGDLGRMVSIRGYRPKLQSKFLNQMAIESTEFDQLFGGNLINDVAVIGTDTYIDEGSSVGVLLHASNTEALKNNLLNKRKRFARTHAKDGVQIVELAHMEQPIQFLKTPDNRYRSFYVTVGDHHLMTTSFWIAKRFVESVKGIRSLADSREFRNARTLMPLSRDDTVFLYLSTRFFQNLLTPKYQIELRRRNRVITDMQLLELATLAAGSEGLPTDSLDELIRLGFLPNGFGNRPDQSVFQTDGTVWRDSIRGRRGFFTPIPDLEYEGVTRDEAAWFAERAEYFSTAFNSLDPIVAGIKRYQKTNDIERVVVDTRIAPFGQEKYGWLISMLGDPLDHQVFGSEEDIVTFQASVTGGSMFRSVRPHVVFAAIQDRLDPGIDLQPQTALKMLRTLKEIPGYLGAWPAPGYLDWLPMGLGREPDENGYSYSRMLNLWRLTWGEFSVLSFQQDRLESLKSSLVVEKTERRAHARVEIKDLVGSRLESWVNSLNYRRSWQTSIANVRLLNTIIHHFKLDPELAKTISERVLNAELVCSLGGEYELFETAGNRKLWASTAWPSFAQPQLPGDYSAPFLKWFRGAKLEVTKAENQFVVHGYIDIQRQPGDSVMNLPGIDLFKGFGNFLQNDQAGNKGASKEKPPVNRRPPGEPPVPVPAPRPAGSGGG